MTLNKKRVLVITLITIAVLLFLGGTATTIALTVRDREENKVITLSFDKTTAYFSSRTELLPIEGTLPTAGDSTECATVIMTASEAAKLRLMIEYTGGSTDIDGLMISVSGVVMPFKDKAVLYESGTETESVTLELIVFLLGDTPISVAERSLSFFLVMTAY